MSVMLAFGLALGSLSYKQQVLASSSIESQYAFYAADAGLECALYADQQQNLFAYPSSDPGSAPKTSCSGSLPISASETWTTSQWVIANRLSLDGGTHCVDITVYKLNPTDSGSIHTYIFSQGYDVSCTTVSTGGARFVARGIDVQY